MLQKGLIKYFTETEYKSCGSLTASDLSLNLGLFSYSSSIKFCSKMSFSYFIQVFVLDLRK